MQDRDNCVKALLKAQEKATGKGIAYPVCGRLSKFDMYQYAIRVRLDFAATARES